MKAILTAATVMLATASASAQSPAPADASEAERMALFEEARKHRVDGDFASCYEKMKRAAAVERTPGVTSLLGDCAVSAGKPAEGAFYLSLALKMKLNAVIRENSEKQLAVARKQIAVVTVALNPADAAPAIDGAPVELVDGKAFLLPGTHAFRAERPGHEPAEASVSLLAGEERTVTLALVPIEKPPPVPVPQPNGDGDSAPMTIAGGVVAGAGLLVFIGGLVPFVLAEGDKTGLQERASATPCGGFPNPSLPSTCAELDGEFDSLKTRNNAGIGLMAAGGGVIAIGLLLVGLDQASDEAPAENQTMGLDVWIGAGAGANLSVPF